MTDRIELPFSTKYTRAHAQRYWRKHQEGTARRLSHWREVQLARKALSLAGDPASVLDLPSGAGRFWPLLAEQPGRAIIGADNSPDMLATARAQQPPEVVARVQPLHTSAFAIDLPDNAVDSLFCMRLLHHVGDAEHRLAMLKEFRRVSRDTVIVSLWVDGNFKAWRRQRHEERRQAQGRQREIPNRFMIPRHVAEAEFEASGFRVLHALDFIPRYAMWRVYVLRAR